MAFETSTGPGYHPELAAKSFIHDCLANTYVEIETTVASQTFDMRALVGTDPAGDPVTVDLGGKRVQLQVITEDGSVMRGTHTMVAGVGIQLTVVDNPFRDFWVDPGVGVENHISVIAEGTGALRFYYNSDL